MKMRTAVLIACVLGCLSPHGAALAADARDDAAGTAPEALISPPLAYSPDVYRAAKRGDAQAQYDLAVALDCGCGVRRDPDGALEWLRKAAEQGHVNAQSTLGWKYMTGDGVPQDDARAFRWLRLAAERGNTSAQNNLGILYAEGRGVAPDSAEAERWFRSAADKGAADAQRNLDALLAGDRRPMRPAAHPTRQRI
jgi:TPR repeat protein